MSAQTCPDHGPVMQESSSKPGTFFCPKKGDGPKGYCRWKMDAKGKRYQWPKDDEGEAPAQHPPHRIEQPVAKQPTSVGGTDAYWLASLDFAAMVYRGTGKSAEAVECAAAVRAILPS